VNRPVPFVGPRSFARGENLYGRDQESLDLFYMLSAERIVLLYSPSGAGKTSLIQAALIPRLEAEGFSVPPSIRVNEAPHPRSASNRYVLSTLLSLEESFPANQRLSLPELETHDLTTYLTQRIAIPDQAREVVLIFDQFEEVLTVDPTDQSAKETFFAQLGAVLRSLRQCWCLFSMREEHVARLKPYLRHIHTRLASTFRLELLGADAAMEVMQKTARQEGVDFTETAAARLTDDLRRVQVQQADGRLVVQPGPSIEPVQLQVVCLRLWEKLPPAATRIDEEAVNALGDVDTVLADYYAERVAAAAAETGIPERDIRAWVDEQLITEQGIRGQVLKSAGASEGLNNAAIQQLIDAHLVRGEQRRGATWFELAHDRLVEPVRQDNATWREANRTEFQQQAERWRQKERPEGLLLRGEPLREAEEWLGDSSLNLSPEEREFIKAGVNLRDREGKYRMWGILGIALVLFVLLGFAVGQSWSAKEQSLIALSRQLAAQAKSLYGSHQYDLGLLLSMQAEAETSTIESKGALLDGLFSSQHISTTLYGHEETVWSVAFSPDGKTLASGSKDGAVILWDITTNPPTSTTLPGHTKQVTSVAFSPDGHILASGGYATIYLWDMTATPPTHITTLRGHTDYVRSVAFSPDGQTLASGSKDGAVILWDVATEQNIGELLRGHTNWVRSVAFSPDGQTLASGGSDQTVILWDITTITSPTSTTLRGHTDQVWSVAFSPDGQTLASGGSDQAVILWDITITSPTSTTLYNEEQERSAITSVAFSPDEQTLASGGYAAIYLWDIATKQPVGEPLRGQNDWVMSVAFSPDGKTLASGSNDSTIKLWNMAGEQQISTPLHGHTYSVNSVAFSPDGQTLASGSNDNTIRLWDTTTGQSVGTHLYSHEEDINSVAFRPDGQALRTLNGHTGSVYSVVFSPDGQTLASASGDHTVRLWRVADGQALRTLTDHTSAVWSVAFSPDGQTLASASSDRTVRLWRVADGQELRTLTGHTGDVTSVAFSPDGQTLASGGTDKDVILWDMTATSPTSTTLRDHTNAVNSVAFSPDGQTLASASCRNKNTSCSLGEVILWDIAMQQPIGTLNHTGQVNSVAFSPDGQTLASGSEDNTIGLWDIATQQQISEPLRGHTNAVNSVAFSPDGQTLASGSEDASIRLWVVSVESWKRRACFKVNRNLSQEEWQRYLGTIPYRKTCPGLPVGEEVE
jgi:WD40 repeat protein